MHSERDRLFARYYRALGHFQTKSGLCGTLAIRCCALCGTLKARTMLPGPIIIASCKMLHQNDVDPRCRSGAHNGTMLLLVEPRERRGVGKLTSRASTLSGRSAADSSPSSRSRSTNRCFMFEQTRGVCEDVHVRGRCRVGDWPDVCVARGARRGLRKRPGLPSSRWSEVLKYRPLSAFLNLRRRKGRTVNQTLALQPIA
jgi:hypothetical protein